MSASRPTCSATAVTVSTVKIIPYGAGAERDAQEHLKEREEVKQALIQRNPHVFEPHVVWDTPATRTNLRGCKCQKTRCVKKYCDCFQNGICCGPNCRCVVEVGGGVDRRTAKTRRKRR